MALQTPDEFFASFLRQQFSLPDPTIYYILKNPKLSDVYQKLIQSCKYFYIRNPILVVPCLEINDDEWKICQSTPADLRESVNVIKKNSLSCKIWITDQIKIVSSESNVVTELIPIVYQCDVKSLHSHFHKLHENRITLELIQSFSFADPSFKLVSMKVELSAMLLLLQHDLTDFFFFGNILIDSNFDALEPMIQQLNKIDEVIFTWMFDKHESRVELQDHLTKIMHKYDKSFEKWWCADFRFGICKYSL